MAKKTKQVPVVGGVYLSPLSSQDVSPGALGEGYFGAVRVLQLIGGLALVSTTTWLGKASPTLHDPVLRESVINNRFAIANQPSILWYEGNMSGRLELLGIVEPTEEETKLECSTYGGRWHDHVAQDALFQWRWDHDREAFEAEVQADGKAQSWPMPAIREYQPMSLKAFWKLVALLDWTKTGNDEAVGAPLVEALSQAPVKDILEFQERLADLLYALDDEKFAREIGEYAYNGPGTYFSSDTFLYARLGAVAKGESLYSRILRDPREMPKDIKFEYLLYVAGYAYEFKTDDCWEGHDTHHCYESFSNEDGWKAL